jgi:hypothetical protein
MPCGSSAMCQPVGSWRPPNRPLEGPETTIGLVQCNLLQLGCRLAAAQLPLSCRSAAAQLPLSCRLAATQLPLSCRCGVVGPGLGVVGSGVACFSLPVFVFDQFAATPAFRLVDPRAPPLPFLPTATSSLLTTTPSAPLGCHCLITSRCLRRQLFPTFADNKSIGHTYCMMRQLPQQTNLVNSYRTDAL